MNGPVPVSDASLHADYFISRAGADRALAIWIGQLIAAQGKRYVLQDEHFGHQDFMGAMDRALKSGARVVALLSQAYLHSEYCLKEAFIAIHGDPFNRLERLIPLRIEPCAPDGNLRNIAYTDLLAERRQADDAALKLKVLRALGLADPVLADGSGLPPAPAGVLIAPPHIVHPAIGHLRTDLAPRPELMAQIKASLNGAGPQIAALTNSPNVVSAIAGMGGVGKTTLARTYAWEERDAYHAVWWIDAETPGGILTGLSGLGAELSAAIKAETNVERAASATLHMIEDMGAPKPFLIVYDNVERPGDLEGRTPRAGAHILVTTRWRDWRAVGGTVDVGVLGREAAIDFLCSQAGRPDDREEAGLLADELGCLPLALDHAAAYIHALTGRYDFKAYREKLAARRLNDKPAEGSRPGQYPHSVRETFAVALDLVISGDGTERHKPHPAAETVVGIASLLAPVPLPYALFDHPRLASDDIDNAFRALAEVSLITAGVDERGEGAFTVHRLVQAVMGDQLAEADRVSDLAALALELVTSAFPQRSDDFSNWPACEVLTPHALAILEVTPDTAQDVSRVSLLAFNVARYLQPVARYSEAELLLKRALAIHEKAMEGEHPDASATLFELAHLYRVQGRYSEAEPLLKRSLAIYEKTMGGGHAERAAPLSELARVYRLQGRHSEAEPLLKRSLAIYEKTVGGEHRDTAATLHALARLYHAQGRYSEAEPLLKRALAIKEKAVGGEHPDAASTLHVLASLYHAQGRYSDAEPLLKRALAIDEKTLGREHPDTSISLRQRARLALDLGRIDQAEAAITLAKAIQQRAWEAEHLRHAETGDVLALVALAKGRLAEAETAAREALSLRERKLPAIHSDIAQSRWTLARVLTAQGRNAEAEPLLGAAIAALKADVTPEHAWLKGAQETLAAVRRERKRRWWFW